MIKSSSEPALRAGSEGGGGIFKIFLGGGGFSRIFNYRGGFGIPPFSHPCQRGYFSINRQNLLDKPRLIYGILG